MDVFQYLLNILIRQWLTFLKVFPENNLFGNLISIKTRNCLYPSKGLPKFSVLRLV